MKGKKLIIVLTIMLNCLTVWSADGDKFMSTVTDGISMAFQVVSEAEKTVEVISDTYNMGQYSLSKYEGDIIIPLSVNGYTVIGIADKAFYQCSSLKSIQFPTTILYIGHESFCKCYSITSLHFPDNVVSIGEAAFQQCSNLSTVYFGTGINKVGSNAFDMCYKLTGVYITDIEAWCSISFEGSFVTNPLKLAKHIYLRGEEIVDLIIPRGIVSIKNQAFWGAEFVTSIIIPEGVTSINERAFAGCIRAKTVNLPSTLESIGWGAFSADSMITTIKLPQTVKKIDDFAFESCYGLTSVIVEWATPLPISNYSFYGSSNAILYVPSGCKAIYETAEGWKNFREIVEIEIGEEMKCATPTIAYDKGELVFSCETEGVKIFSEVKVADAKSNEGERVQLMPTYIINVYATKDGFEDSDVATATIRWRDGRPLMEGFSNVKVNMVEASDTNGDNVVDVADIAAVIDVMAASTRQQQFTDGEE